LPLWTSLLYGHLDCAGKFGGLLARQGQAQKVVHLIQNQCAVRTTRPEPTSLLFRPFTVEKFCPQGIIDRKLLSAKF